MKKLILICTSLLSFLMGCTDFELSPNQAFDYNTPTNLNLNNQTKLNTIPNDDTLRFVVLGDPQKSSNELDLFIGEANRIHQSKKIDLVFIAGDLSEFGLLQETEWVAHRLLDLKMPFFAVVGNHDLLANGSTAFKKIFGPLNYTITYDGVKFICHDTNSREYKFNGIVPDLNWLMKETVNLPTVKNFIAISHIRPFTDDFDNSLADVYTKTFTDNPRFLASFHAHEHSFNEYSYNNSPLPFVVTTTIGKRGYILAEIINNKLSYERIEF